ncbi:hypothetical protein B0J12DRAFT_789052 [Macrophomina phaseolina]|uniref:Nephrocystin 3-like N-terminal domain-containing protein n=1 Tax=Macrophomina phaseolina TaxID=35725 RepID=A0ABQ8G134_9PEZI|nr:hypothetical protein B0J12DRAFT_789052 [Macrophomina phaseolina]
MNMDGENYTGPHMTGKKLLERKMKSHLALSERHELTPDIYAPLFDWIFRNKRFQCWQLGESRWQLRCVGAPGSGKASVGDIPSHQGYPLQYLQTTFAAVAARKLREIHRDGKAVVASVFIQADVISHEASFIEDILASIFRQLCAVNRPHARDVIVMEKYEEYVQAREERQRNHTRIKLIRGALHARLHTLERAFLIIDGIDRCSSALDLFLENELSQLQNGNVKIMITSRIPCLREPAEVVVCDGCDSEEHMVLFWRCKTCKGELFDLCQHCKMKGIFCGNCGPENPQFRQPFDHVDLEIAFPSMADYISWDLQTEHGDLGLLEMAPGDPDCPSLSTLGEELAKNRHQSSAKRLVDMISRQASGNISMARLTLERVHCMHTIKGVEAFADRLPISFIATFDAIMEGIENQPCGIRELGLKAIAAMANCPFDQGVEFVNLERWLQEHSSLSDNERHIQHRSLEEILHATKGVLVVPHYAHRPLKAFHQDFYEYARERYRESLVWAHAQLRFGKLADSQKVRRSQTVVPFGQNNPLDKKLEIPA